MNQNEPPVEKDQLIDDFSKVGKQQNASQPLSEKDFIRNKPFLKSFPFWLWLFLVSILVILGIGIKGWYDRLVEKTEEREPFMEVTNREFSVFLWQFPSFLRSNVSKKTGYMTAFLFDRENFDPLKGEEFVSAPPDLIFLYHTWSRLLSTDFISRPIKPEEFDAFLTQLPEWDPKNWKAAPDGYSKLITSKEYLKVPDMEALPQEELPRMVRQAFEGWKNYFKEGNKINSLKPTIEQVQDFLKKHPTYARPFWRNIDKVNGKEVAGLNYLYVLLHPSKDVKVKVPEDQLASFLKVSMFMAEEKQ